MIFHLLAEIDPNGCRELPFVQSAAQTYSDYLNGASGYLVFIVGATILGASLVSKKLLGKMPGWLGGIIIVALSLAALPALLGAFGLNLGCSGGGVVDNAPAQNNAMVAPEWTAR